MTAIILLPENNGGYEFAHIYRSSTLTGEYSLIDTVRSKQLEYEDSDGDYLSYYKVAWYDGTTESSNKIPVQSSIQKIIDIVRIECKINATVLPDSEIYFLVNDIRRTIQMDICKFTYGYQITKLADGIYQLPGRFYYDHNCGGAVSILDIDLFKQTIPLTLYSPKITVQALDADFEDYWVKVDPLESTEILKVNYYETGRPVEPETLNQLIAYKISSNYFENLAASTVAETSTNPYSKVTIGPISITNGTSTSTRTSVVNDFANKMNAKYNKLISYYKIGFKRVN